MIKNLIFCLLVLTGAGMLNSCQQDEVVNEALENKEIIIRASLPDDELSRVILDDNTTGATTSLYWETGDKIITTINGVDYEFEVLTIGSDRTTATFKYTNNKGQLPTGTCTFTYGATPEIGLIQDGTKDGLSNTVIVQGNDGVDIWYSGVSLNEYGLYDYVSEGDVLGGSILEYGFVSIVKDGEKITYEEYFK